MDKGVNFDGSSRYLEWMGNKESAMHCRIFSCLAIVCFMCVSMDVRADAYDDWQNTKKKYTRPASCPYPSGTKTCATLAGAAKQNCRNMAAAKCRDYNPKGFCAMKCENAMTRMGDPCQSPKVVSFCSNFLGRVNWSKTCQNVTKRVESYAGDFNRAVARMPTIAKAIIEFKKTNTCRRLKCKYHMDMCLEAYEKGKARVAYNAKWGDRCKRVKHIYWKISRKVIESFHGKEAIEALKKSPAAYKEITDIQKISDWKQAPCMNEVGHCYRDLKAARQRWVDHVNNYKIGHRNLINLDVKSERHMQAVATIDKQIAKANQFVIGVNNSLGSWKADLSTFKAYIESIKKEKEKLIKEWKEILAKRRCPKGKSGGKWSSIVKRFWEKEVTKGKKYKVKVYRYRLKGERYRRTTPLTLVVNDYQKGFVCIKKIYRDKSQKPRCWVESTGMARKKHPGTRWSRWDVGAVGHSEDFEVLCKNINK